MTDPLKTEDAVTEVTCLEDKILLDEGKQGGEDLTTTSARLEAWEVEFARMIKARMNTKFTNVYRCAIHHGEKEIREAIGESADHDYIHETEQMWILTTAVLPSEAKCPNKLRKVIREIQELDHGVELGIEAETVDDPIYLSYRESVGSAIHDTWDMMANESRTAALRNIIAIGLGYSDMSDDFFPGYGDEALRQTVRMFRRVREILEMNIADYASSAVVEWSLEGYSDKESEILHEIHGMMTTDYQRQVREAMELVDMYDGANPQLSSEWESDWEKFIDR